jgi:hypothetical protein
MVVATIDTDWISRAEAAKRLHLTVGRVSQLMNEERLRVLPTPLGRLISGESVAAYERWRQRVRDARNSSYE